MTSNDMGPAFGFILIAMMALLILNSITANSNSALFTRAMEILDDSFQRASCRMKIYLNHIKIKWITVRFLAQRIFHGKK